ncbi:cytochrome c oxidase subunit II [Cyanobium sp. LEGE 06113]|uniref:cytochrome c oxidase subunit II n=2 Tax=unclassified Cyanobium TaxID=2627006 RepID=UPI001881EC16|nr:cytochrome c oxidase subunit II [Cyanobium sp. LEGE 06113]MBE9154660.1 cytochrome c oxidase subunit II [Cyanobium sp. LEGE 06113]
MTSSSRLMPLGLGLGAAVLLDGWLSLGMARLSHRWLPVQASAAAPHVDNLFALETGIGSFIFFGCLGVIGWTLLFNRAPKYDMEDGAPIEGNLKLEVVWTVIPLLVVMAISWHAIGVNRTLATLGGKLRLPTAAAPVLEAGPLTAQAAGLAASDPAAAPEPITVLARQWSWEFIYPNGVRSTELHLPVDERAHFRLQSLDVIHGFYVPAFRLKQDLIPGSVIDYSLIPTRPGRYRLRDSMFSGAYFAANQTDVVVETPQRFQAWLEAASREPLRPGANPAVELYKQRQARGDRGWATVPPAPAPQVNVSADPSAPHDA